MMGETAAAVFARATATDRTLQRVPGPSAALIIAETDQPMTDIENQFLTLEDVADRLKLSIHTIRDHERRGILSASRLGRRVRVSSEQFAEYVRRLEARGAGAEIEDLERSAARDLILETIREAIAAGRFDDMIRRIVREELAARGGA